MNIDNIQIKHCDFSGFSMQDNDGMLHIKQLPYLSIVQSTTGSYKIRIDNGAEYSTAEGGFFIAPSAATQTITHYLNKESRTFAARYIFLDVIINNSYHIDDIYDFPVIAEAESAVIFNRYFDEYEASECICDKMCCVWKIIKQLLHIATPKPAMRNRDIYPLTEYFASNYHRQITVEQMADILSMSPSNLYAVFKKATGTSPIKYLNDYRLSVACGLLLQTELSIKSIAEKVGIPDQFYFSKLFRTKYLTSPRNYRKNNTY